MEKNLWTAKKMHTLHVDQISRVYPWSYLLSADVLVEGEVVRIQGT